MTRSQESYYLAHAAEIGTRAPKAIQMLTEAIMNSGFSMAIVGESSPSSGSEHLIAHYWEMMDDLAGRPTQLHGARVGLGTLIAASLYERVLSKSPADVNLARARKNFKTEDDLRALVTQYYGAVADETFRETVKKCVPWATKEKELTTLRDRWSDIWADVKRYLRPRAELEGHLRAAGAPVRCADLGISRADALNAIRYARLLRNRYTILDLADDLGWLDGWAEELLDEFAG
jgi:glycerol-1-phosphate dehydrogenase [NAD(P)+]